MKMIKKFNWGHGVALGYSAFAVGMIFLVYLCVQQKIELVRPDYYTQELKYQQRIDQKANTAALKQRLEINYIRENDLVEIIFPSDLTNTHSVQVHLYRPDDSSLDKTSIQTLSNNKINVDTKDLKEGLWRLELTWSCNDKEYFQETILNI
jgi:hypothetical protein